MPVQKNYMGSNFLQLDKAAYKALSKNAIIVYLAFVNIHPNADPKDPFMAKQSGMGLSTYKKAKQELIKKEYLYVQRLGAKGATIIYHFGAKAVKAIKSKLEDKKLARLKKG